MKRIKLTIRGKSEFEEVPAILGSAIKFGGLDFVWWGFSQVYKWRWHGDHIDLGMLSVYGFRKNHPFWRFVAMFIKPMRWQYHQRFCKCKPSVNPPTNPVGFVDEH